MSHGCSSSRLGHAIIVAVVGHPAHRTALVTGATRGLGLACARRLAEEGLTVVVTGRDLDRARERADVLAGEGARALPEQLEVTDPGSVERCSRALSRAGVDVDVLVNNAAIELDEGWSALDIDEETLRRTLDTNLLGVFRTSRTFIPGMIRRGYGRVVNVSSGAGSLTSMRGYAPAYSISKAALNALTRQLAAHVRGDVKVNAADPGWVRTDMGGPAAPRSVEQGADTIVWLATLPTDGPNGGFFYERRPADW
jgi:NAD(P)-dependent dehydrogenase (short-subunit alcohol dehydrogenase family)